MATASSTCATARSLRRTRIRSGRGIIRWNTAFEANRRWSLVPPDVHPRGAIYGMIFPPFEVAIKIAIAEYSEGASGAPVSAHKTARTWGTAENNKGKRSGQ